MRSALLTQLVTPSLHRNDGRSWSDAPWIVRLERTLSYIDGVGQAIILTILLVTGLYSWPKYVIAAAILGPILALMIWMNVWYIVAIPRGTRAVWYAHIVMTVLGASFIAYRRVGGHPYSVSDIRTVLELVAFIPWLAADTRAWFRIGKRS